MHEETTKICAKSPVKFPLTKHLYRMEWYALMNLRSQSYEYIIPNLNQSIRGTSKSMDHIHLGLAVIPRVSCYMRI